MAIDTEYIRLDNFLKLCGAFVTGGQAKQAIQSGLVKVNGETCYMRGKKLRPGDRAEFEGKIYEAAGA
jgi:ribosome-associated protein